MESFEVDEKNLQQELMKLCDLKGRENNPQRSADIFNALGLLYKKKSPDKISLIQSAALLNAAIIRQPYNEKFRDDLNGLCTHVLDCANAAKKDANLLDVSQNAANQIEKMRSRVTAGLKNVEKISKSRDRPIDIMKESMRYVESFQPVQDNLTMEYKNIMIYIAKQCFDIYGEPPCKYALIGMGSLAKNEITPYSDFEHILTFENQEETNQVNYIKEFFRWFTTIFHIIVINLQETDLYSVCVPCLNDFSKPNGNWFYDKVTRQGISFDGMMPHACHFPLGKTKQTDDLPWTAELIQPINEMVKYLAVKDIKQGYKLGDLLTKTCFVGGDEDIYLQFSEKVKSTIRRNLGEQMANVRKQLTEDFEKFHAYQNLSMFRFNKSINIKREIYRGITLFLSALGRLQGFDSNSSFEIIQELQRKKLISNYVAQRLFHSVAVVCHVRLSYYMDNDRQQDDIHDESEIWGKQKLQELTKIVSFYSLINCWTTASVVQQIAMEFKNLKRFDILFKQKSLPAQLMVLNLVGSYKESIYGGESCLEDHASLGEHYADVLYNLGVAYIRTRQYEKCIALHEKHGKKITPTYGMKVNELESLFHLGKYELVVSESDAILKLNPDVSKYEFEYGFLLHLNGSNKYRLKNYRGALSAFRDVIEFKKSNKTWYHGVDHAVTMRYIALSLIGQGRSEQGLHWAWEGLNYLEKIDATRICFKWFTDILKGQYPHSLEDEIAYPHSETVALERGHTVSG